MKTRIGLFCALALIMMGGVRNSNADDWNRLTYIHTDSALIIPHAQLVGGGDELPPGDYSLALLDLSSGAPVVNIDSADRMQHFGLVLGIPADRGPDWRGYYDRETSRGLELQRFDDTGLLEFMDRGDGALVLHKWFYPGDNMGIEFPGYGEDEDVVPGPKPGDYKPGPALYTEESSFRFRPHPITTIHHGVHPWRHWGHPEFVRPVFNWRWDGLKTVTCTADNNGGELFPVTEDGYSGFEYQANLVNIEDAAIDRCYSETNGDTSCRLLSCSPAY